MSPVNVLLIVAMVLAVGTASAASARGVLAPHLPTLDYRYPAVRTDPATGKAEFYCPAQGGWQRVPQLDRKR
jgi:hypothetical protein